MFFQKARVLRYIYLKKPQPTTTLVILKILFSSNSQHHYFIFFQVIITILLYIVSHASANSRCAEPGEGSQVSRRAPQGQHRGTLQPVSRLHRSPNWNTSVQTHTDWGINERSQRHAHACRAMSSLASWRCGGMAPVTGVLEVKAL